MSNVTTHFRALTLAAAMLAGGAIALGTTQQDPAGRPGGTPPKPSMPAPPAPSSAGPQATPPARPSIRPPSAPGARNEDQLVRVKMLSDVARIKPGEKFHLAFVFDISATWHIYWENGGISGVPTTIDVKTPTGFAVGKTLFPRPRAFTTPEGPAYGYEERTVLMVEITPPATAPAVVNFTAQSSWLVCKDVCKMGSAQSMLSLPFGETSVPAASPVEIDPIIKDYKSRLPKPLKDVAGATAEFDGQNLTIILPAQGSDGAEFFPNPSAGVEFGEVKFQRHGDMQQVSVPVTLNPNNALGKPMRLGGVVGLGRSMQEPCYEFDIPLGADGRPQRNTP